MDEKELILGIKEGNEDAFRTMVDKYQDLVVNVCNSFLHSHDDSMDVSQEVFIKVYQNINSFREDAKLSTWLYRISVNKSLNFIRSKKRQKWFNGLDDLFNGDSESNKVIEPESQDAIPGDDIEKQEEYKALNYALSTLPEKQRIAITLYHYDELPYKEIAENLYFVGKARQKMQDTAASPVVASYSYADFYLKAFEDYDLIELPPVRKNVRHAWHLFSFHRLSPAAIT